MSFLYATSYLPPSDEQMSICSLASIYKRLLAARAHVSVPFALECVHLDLEYASIVVATSSSTNAMSTLRLCMDARNHSRAAKPHRSLRCNPRTSRWRSRRACRAHQTQSPLVVLRSRCCNAGSWLRVFALTLDEWPFLKCSVRKSNSRQASVILSVVASAFG